MTHSPIAVELLKQLEQLPPEYQKKVLELAKVLNTFISKGEPSKDFSNTAGTIDPESLKITEEAVEYGCEKTKTNPNLERIEQVIFNLPFEEQLEFMEKMISHLKEQNLKPNETKFNWNEYYGIAKGLWNEDAQQYVNHLREDR
jgi:hypothetical protein